jgi:hypothetical protein
VSQVPALYPLTAAGTTPPSGVYLLPTNVLARLIVARYLLVHLLARPLRATDNRNSRASMSQARSWSLQAHDCFLRSASMVGIFFCFEKKNPDSKAISLIWSLVH